MTTKVLLYNSIQELLTSNNYVVDLDNNWFFKSIGNERMIVIPFAMLAGHSVKTFYEKAEQCGWFQSVRCEPPQQETPPLYQFTSDQIF
jgi:hypothetical protein